MSRKQNSKYSNRGKGKGSPSNTSNTKGSKESAVPESSQEYSNDTNKTSAPKTNDPEWYMRDEQLAFDAANLPFAKPLGSPFDLLNGQSVLGPAQVPINENLLSRSIGTDPGLCTVWLKPAYGRSLSKTSPLNVAANAFYANVRYVNSGRRNYDPADLMLYALAIGETYSFVMWLQKLYQCAFMYSQRNWFVGRVLVEAMGIDFENIVENLANFRYGVNAFINKIASWPVPASIPLFYRKAFIYANTYTQSEDNDIKDRLYQFTPRGFYQFAIDERGKGMLNFKSVDKLSTVAELLTYGNELIDALTGDEDFGLMAGDILKAYGKDIITLQPLGSDPVANIVYDEHVLSQFRNCIFSYEITTLPGIRPQDVNEQHRYNIPDSGTTPQQGVYGNVYQNDVGNLISIEAMQVDTDATPCSDDANTLAAITEHAVLLNQQMASPTPADNLEATRLLWTSSLAEITGTVITMELFCGSEVATQVKYSNYYFVNRRSKTYGIEHTMFANSAYGIDQTQFGSLKSFTFRNFKHAPVEYYALFSNDDDDGILMSLEPVGNLMNCTWLTTEQVQRIHEVALLSLVYVPGIAKVM